MAEEEQELYLPEHVWEHIFALFFNSNGCNHCQLQCLSIVSKQFLSITNRLIFSLTVYNPTPPFLPNFLHRFSNLTSLDFSSYTIGDLDELLQKITFLPLPLIKSLNLSNQDTIPANGLRSFSKKVATLTSLTCSNIVSIHKSDVFLIAQCFPLLEKLDLSFPAFCDFDDQSMTLFSSIYPNLKLVDLSFCYGISVGVVEILRTCCKIMFLDLTSCPKVNLLGMNFKVPQLEVLNLSMTRVDDETLYVISKSCFGLLELDLEQCFHITEEGVKQVVESCTRLKFMNLRGCHKVAADVDLWMMIVLSRPSLKKIVVPSHFRPSDSKWRCLLDLGCLLG